VSMRVRRRNSLAFSDVTQIRTAGSPCPPSKVVRGRVPNGTIEYMEDVLTPNFRRRSGKGEIIFNRMHRWKYAVACSGSGASIKAADPKLTCEFYSTSGAEFGLCVPYQNWDGVSLPLSSYNFGEDQLADLCSEVSTEVLADRGKADSNLWETLAEVDKTVGMLSPTLQKLTLLLDRAARATQKGRALRFATSAASGVWLQYRYGMKPLVKDMEHILKTLRNLSFKVERRTTRKTQRIESVRSISGFGVSDVSVVQWSNLITDRVTVRAMSLDEVDQSLWKDLGFGEKSLLTLPWELLPYSFVVDWLVNVGSYINALVPAGLGWKALGSCLTIERVLTNVYTAGASSSNNGGYVITAPITGTVGTTLIEKRRQPLSPAKLVMRSDFRLDNATRVTDAITLLASRFVDVFGESHVPRANRTRTTVWKDPTRWT